MLGILLIVVLLSATHTYAFTCKGRSAAVGSNWRQRSHCPSTRLGAFWPNRHGPIAPLNENERLLYGRVPFDDWMFTNWKLTDPNIYKRTYIESIADEMSIAAKHHALRQTYSMLVNRVAWASGAVLVALVGLNLFKTRIRDALLALLNAISPTRRAAGVDFDYGEATYSPEE